MAPRIARIVPPKFHNLALGIEFCTLGYLSYELARVYRGTHPQLSPKLAGAGLWPMPKLPALKQGEKKEEGKTEEKSDVRWMSINGVPVPASFDAITGFWRR